MAHFGAKPRFEFLADGTVCARSGTQTNCSGIAGIVGRITTSATPGLVFTVAGGHEPHEPFGPHVPGADVPREIRESVRDGAQDEYNSRELQGGICFQLIEAVVHPVDGKQSHFYRVGRQALAGWLDHPRPTGDAR